MKIFSFKNIFKSKKIILSSILLLLLGGTIVDFNSLKLISVVITIMLVAGMSMKNSKKTSINNEIYREEHHYSKDDLENINQKNKEESIDKENKTDNKTDKPKLNIKETIKKNKEDYNLNQTYTDYTENPYQTDIKNIQHKYLSKDQDYNFELKINQSLCSTPIFYNT